jgi:predicted RNase H-like HicB family nuclease
MDSDERTHRVRERSSLSNSTKLRSFEIEVARAGEGVWTATSESIPGLNIEGETFEEAIAEARMWAPELLRANGVVAESETVELVFSREGERLVIE